MKIDLEKDIILPAWNTIKDDSKAKKMFFFPWLLSIIFLTVLLVYQSIYTYVVIFHKKEKALEIILNFFHSQYSLEVIISAIIFLLFYIILIPIFEWAGIKFIEIKDKEKISSSSESLSVGLYRFLPLFKYNNLFSEFKFISILNWYLFIIRFFNWEYIKIISYSFLVIFLFSTIINILFAYTQYIIVLENKDVFKSISKSIKLSLLNIWMTTRLYFSMFFLNLRVIINFIVFLSFPILIWITIWLITTKLYLTIAISILTILFITFIIISWYLTWVLEILKTSIWYYAYKNWNKKLTNLEKNKNI